ncbi:S1 family peptidase [Massilia polaris]|nr:serine protease [Massilia polaris]
MMPRHARETLLLLFTLVLGAPARADDLVRTIQAVKPSVVGIGTYQRTRSPAVQFVATGFVVGDGRSVITNAHGIPANLDLANMETLGVVIGNRGKVEFRPATVVARDPAHDLAHLRIEGAALPALALGGPADVAEGQSLAFTGFPLGMVLGLHAATHRASLAVIAPIVLPALSSGKLNSRTVSRLSAPAFPIYQLDATAYPGNSGSPVYDPQTGVVHAVINMVLVKGLKESAISTPSGISYAIPVKHVRDLLEQAAP